jgi:hypothetical protein
VKRLLRTLGSRLVLWNRLTMGRPYSEQVGMRLRPSLLGLIIERRRQKKLMKEGF